MKTTDNNDGKFIVDPNDKIYKDLQKIANIKISDIKQDEYPNLLVFPRDWTVYEDGVGSSEIFSLHDKKLTTRNIMGFIGINDTNIAITSRFTPENNDNFLYYMLEKVMAINVVNLHYDGSKNDILDFLIFFFPYFLNKALSQGLYKEYKHNECNDANIKGRIDVNRHIRLNLPFTGKIAYSTREYDNNNPVIQLIRHTIEYIKTNKFNSVLIKNSDLTSNINQVMLSTADYNRNNREKIININKKKPVVHPYFTEYKELQKLCIRILTNEKISSGNEKEKIHGILFDGAWLWEEYLNTILRDLKFEHPNNKTGKGRNYLFKNSEGRNTNAIYPDFINKELKIIADAKYKPIENYLSNQKTGERNDNSDYYQIITYMYRFNCKKGYLIFPYSRDKNIEPEEKNILQGLEGEKGESKVIILGMKIPKNDDIKKFDKFREEMVNIENALKGNFHPNSEPIKDLN